MMNLLIIMPTQKLFSSIMIQCFNPSVRPPIPTPWEYMTCDMVSQMHILSLAPAPSSNFIPAHIGPSA